MQAPDNRSNAAASSLINKAWPWMLAGVCLIYVFLLGGMPLANPDEGRYAEIPREMLASGDWVSPQLDGTVYFEKPPLMYWTAALSMKLFGPGETSLRLVPVFFAFLGLGMTVYTARRLGSARAGWLAGLVLGTSVLYFALARILILDMAVSVLMAGALCCFLLGVNEPAGGRRRTYFMGLYVFMALATLAKGLIGFLLPGFVMFSWLLVFNQWRRLRPLYLPTGTLLFLAIALPWHLLVASRNPQWAQFYLVHEHWQRFTTTTHSRTAPVWYFVPIIILGLVPWTGLLFPSFRAVFASGWSRRKELASEWFLVSWAVLIFLFFSKSQSKLAPYILPIFPALAILIGLWLDRVLDSAERASLRLGLWINAAILGLVILAMVVIAIHPQLIHQKDIADVIRPYAIILSVLLSAGLAVMLAMLLRRREPAAVGGLVLTMALLLGGVCVLVPKVVQRNTKVLAEIVRERAAPGDQVLHYRGFFHDFLFYSGRLVSTVDCENELELDIDPQARSSGRFMDEAAFRKLWEGDTRLWVVARKSEVEGPDKLFAKPGFHYHRIAENTQHVLFSNRP